MNDGYNNLIGYNDLQTATSLISELLIILSHPFNYYILQNAEDYKKTLKISGLPRNLFIDKERYIRYIQGSFPYKALDREKGIMSLMIIITSSGLLKN